MITTTRRALAVSAAALTTFMGVSACKAPTPDKPATPPTAITLKEVCAAQKAWGDALVAISTAFDDNKPEEAKRLAKNAIDTAYGYGLGPVLFKPTLTATPQTFRTTEEGALAYFVGDNPKYPSDKGFARLHWRSVTVRNVGVQINGDVANTMGKVVFRDKDNEVITVDKTWTFKKDSQGKVRIILHHSSEAMPASPGTYPPGAIEAETGPDACATAT